MGHLFYEALGGKAQESILNQSGDSAAEVASLALLTNVQPTAYWSSTDFGPNSTFAWYFHASTGFQYTQGKIGYGYALAVRPGDVTAAVPEPQSYAMLLLGLGGLLLARRRQAR